jgi:hypothetical protein
MLLGERRRHRRRVDLRDSSARPVMGLRRVIVPVPFTPRLGGSLVFVTPVIRRSPAPGRRTEVPDRRRERRLAPSLPGCPAGALRADRPPGPGRNRSRPGPQPLVRQRGRSDLRYPGPGPYPVRRPRHALYGFRVRPERG